MNKIIFKVQDCNKKTLGVFLSNSEESLAEYIKKNDLFSHLNKYTISKLSNEEIIEEDTAPIMVAQRKLWYDLRHEKYILIFDEAAHD